MDCFASLAMTVGRKITFKTLYAVQFAKRSRSMFATIANIRAPRMTAAITDIPEGFEPHFRKSPFTDPWEPLYSRRTDKAVIMGLRLAKPHTNARGLIHGGLIASLADNAMGYSCGQVARLGAASSLVTIGLAVDFVGS